MRRRTHVHRDHHGRGVAGVLQSRRPAALGPSAAVDAAEPLVDHRHLGVAPTFTSPSPAALDSPSVAVSVVVASCPVAGSSVAFVVSGESSPPQATSAPTARARTASPRAANGRRAARLARCTGASTETVIGSPVVLVSVSCRAAPGGPVAAAHQDITADLSVSAGGARAAVAFRPVTSRAVHDRVTHGATARPPWPEWRWRWRWRPRAGRLRRGRRGRLASPGGEAVDARPGPPASLLLPGDLPDGYEVTRAAMTDPPDGGGTALLAAPDGRGGEPGQPVIVVGSSSGSASIAGAAGRASRWRTWATPSSSALRGRGRAVDLGRLPLPRQLLPGLPVVRGRQGRRRGRPRRRGPGHHRRAGKGPGGGPRLARRHGPRGRRPPAGRPHRHRRRAGVGGGNGRGRRRRLAGGDRRAPGAAGGGRPARAGPAVGVLGRRPRRLDDPGEPGWSGALGATIDEADRARVWTEDGLVVAAVAWDMDDATVDAIVDGLRPATTEDLAALGDAAVQREPVVTGTGSAAAVATGVVGDHRWTVQFDGAANQDPYLVSQALPHVPRVARRAPAGGQSCWDRSGRSPPSGSPRAATACRDVQSTAPPRPDDLLRPLSPDGRTLPTQLLTGGPRDQGGAFATFDPAIPDGTTAIARDAAAPSWPAAPPQPRTRTRSSCKLRRRAPTTTSGAVFRLGRRRPDADPDPAVVGVGQTTVSRGCARRRPSSTWPAGWRPSARTGAHVGSACHLRPTPTCWGSTSATSDCATPGVA